MRSEEGYKLTIFLRNLNLLKTSNYVTRFNDLNIIEDFKIPVEIDVFRLIKLKQADIAKLLNSDSSFNGDLKSKLLTAISSLLKISSDKLKSDLLLGHHNSRYLKSAILRCLKPGLLVYLWVWEDPLTSYILKFHGINPLYIRSLNDKPLEPDISMLIRNYVEGSVIYFSIPNKLNGYFNIDLISNISDLISRKTGCLIADLSNIFTFLRRSGSKYSYSSDIFENILSNALIRLLNSIESKSACIYISFNTYLAPLNLDYSIILTFEEYIKRIKILTSLESQNHLIYDVMSINGLNYIANSEEYLKNLSELIAQRLNTLIEVMGDRILLPEGEYFGGYNVILDISPYKDREFVDNLAGKISVSMLPFSIVSGCRSSYIILNLASVPYMEDDSKWIDEISLISRVLMLG